VDAILILKQMHEDVKGQFEELLHTYYPFQAQEFWRELQPLLNRHRQIEETYVYGPLRQGPDAGAALTEWVEQHDHQVERMQRLIQEANALEPVDSRWHTHLARLRDAVGEHIRQEEEEIFPRIEQVWDASRREQAGRQIEQLRL
jgi:iron-sulfur cluster repair protein YtfE (RIC family)